MGDTGTSVTLIFYRVGDQWWKEPALNLLAAAAQFSSYTHVEIAIGETAGINGQMANVARVFNDAIGVVSFQLEQTRRVHYLIQAITLLYPCVCTGTLSAHRTQPRGKLHAPLDVQATATLLASCLPLQHLCIDLTVSELHVFAVHLPFAGVFQGGRSAHARLCESASGQALQQHGHGTIPCVATRDNGVHVLLCRCVLAL